MLNKKNLSKLGLLTIVLLLLISSIFALSYEGVSFTTNVSNTTVNFDIAVEVESININNNSIDLINMYYDDCIIPQSSYYFNKTFSEINTTYLSSLFGTTVCPQTLSYNIDNGAELLKGYYIIFIFYSICVLCVTSLSLFVGYQLNKFKFIKGNILGWIIIALFLEVMILTISLANLLLNSAP